MFQINNITIDTSSMPPAETTRTITSVGENGAKFILMIIDTHTDSDEQHLYYNWFSSTFEIGHVSKYNNLIVELDQNKKNESVVHFPSGAGTYLIKILPFPGTKVLNKNAYTAQISKQNANATITFTPSATLDSANYTTFPTLTSAGAPNDLNKIDFSFTITNTSSDAKGFGFVNDYNIVTSDDWYYSATEAILLNLNDDGEDSRSVTVASLTGIGLGSELFYHKATTVPTTKAGAVIAGVTYVQSIETNALTGESIITFNNEVAFEETETMTFKSRGVTNIFNATGISLTFGTTTTITPSKLAKTIRAGSSGTTINLNGTYGIAGGNLAGLVGLGIDNSSANKITSVSASSSAGAIVVQNSQSGLTTGSTVEIIDSSQVVTISGSIKISKYPESDATINLDLNKIITVGEAS